MDNLTNKFGKRFRDYRKDYYSYIDNYNSDYLFQPIYPLTVLLELVNRCNLGCIMCDQGFRNDVNKVTITDEALTKIFQDFKENNLSALMLSISEPLLYKNIENVLNMAKESGIMDLFLFTNGILLGPEKLRMILNSSVTRLFISVDANSEETYNIIRPKAKNNGKNQSNRLGKLEENIINFIDMRNSLGKQLPLVRVSFVAKDENSHEIDDFINKWVKIVDSVEIQEEASIKVFDQIRNGDHLIMNNNNDVNSYKCNEPWGQMTIYSNGDVGPCCNAVGHYVPIGNVLNESISEIWNGKKMEHIREGFKNGTPNNICRLCLQNMGSEYFNS